MESRPRFLRLVKMFLSRENMSFDDYKRKPAFENEKSVSWYDCSLRHVLTCINKEEQTLLCNGKHICIYYYTVCEMHLSAISIGCFMGIRLLAKEMLQRINGFLDKTTDAEIRRIIT